jgi:hypothetical protein
LLGLRVRSCILLRGLEWILEGNYERRRSGNIWMVILVHVSRVLKIIILWGSLNIVIAISTVHLAEDHGIWQLFDDPLMKVPHLDGIALNNREWRVCFGSFELWVSKLLFRLLKLVTPVGISCPAYPAFLVLTLRVLSKAWINVWTQVPHVNPTGPTSQWLRVLHSVVLLLYKCLNALLVVH